MLTLISIFVWLQAYSGFQITNFITLIISAVCTILSVAEIILFAATRLHPLTYRILQLVKTIIWFILFALATVDTIAVQEEVKAEQVQGFDSEHFFLEGFVETLVLFVTFLAALIYASVVYRRHRRARARLLRSLQDTDLFPMIDDEAAKPVGSHRILRAPRNSLKEMCPGQEISHPAAMKEAVEVTVLRELGGDWEVHELPATRSVRSSKGGKSTRSLKEVK